MKRFKNILMYAGTEETTAAISRSVKLALENDADLTLIDVIKPIPHAIGMMTDVAPPEELERLVAEEHRDKLLQKAADFSDTGVELNVTVRIGQTPIEIVREVIEGGYDLVVKTADGPSALNRLFGSTAQTLMRSCPCPVWILKPDLHGTFQRVLVALDVEAHDEKHDQLNRDLLEIAHSIARFDRAQLHLVSAWDLWMERSLRRRAGDDEIDSICQNRQGHLRELLEHSLAQAKIDPGQVQLHLQRGSADQQICRVASQIEADLLVMGTVCRTGIAGFLIGNTAEHVLANVICSVLTLKPEGFVCPVDLDVAGLGENESWLADQDSQPI